MALAILQNELIQPSAEQLVAAFAALPELTDFDARRRAQDAVGVIADRLDEDQATTLLGALAEQNIAASIVEGSDLPQLPTPYRIHEAMPGDGELLVLDGMNQPLTFAWSDVTLIAAGMVNLMDIRTQVTTHVRYSAAGFGYPVQDHKTTETRHVDPLAEVHLRSEPWRLRIEARGFRFGYLGADAPHDLGRRFALLVGDLTRRAPQALINRGVENIAQGRTPRTYRTAALFERELTWLLWLSRTLLAKPAD